MPKEKSSSNNTQFFVIVGVIIVTLIMIVVAFMLMKEPSVSTKTTTNTTVAQTNTNTRANTNVARNTNTSSNKNTNSTANKNTNVSTNSNTNTSTTVNTNSNTNSATNTNTTQTNTNVSTNTNASTSTNTNSSSLSGATDKNTNEVEVDADGNKTRLVDLYFINLDDAGMNGDSVGCGDSMIAVERRADLTGFSTTGSVWAAIAFLTSLHSQTQYGYYNALYQSDLEVENVVLSGGVAHVYLTGTTQLGGTCDTPRFENQLIYTATQFPDVSSAVIYINGTEMTEALSTK